MKPMMPRYVSPEEWDARREQVRRANSERAKAAWGEAQAKLVRKR